MSPSSPLAFTGCLAVSMVVFSAAAADPKPAAAADGLPLKKVVLFTSGVGFFQHAGQVTGDAAVEMKFAADDVNDLLKSMVLEDLGGGTVSTVSYASRDPITKTLGTFAVNLTDNPSLGQILGRLRGEKIEVDAAAPAAGTIVGVEKRTVPAGDNKTVEKEFITLLTADGLKTLALDTITRIKLVDPRLQGELEKALAVLAMGHDNDKKAVRLEFRGQGQRDVRVGYVQESPLWKTSYRLVVDDAADGDKRQQALLQGWAIVENTTDQDWKDVRMELVSGRPISFTMDLYQPLYVPRPEGMPELYASLLPQVYGQSLADATLEFERAKAGEAKGDAQRGLPADKSELKRQMAAAPHAPGAAGREASDRKAAADRDGTFAAIDSIQSVAAGTNLGELFRYAIEKPVTIERQRSAMLPIVGEKVDAEKVAIYDDRVLAKHPLSGLRLMNSTKLDLMQGPVTVFEAGAYAGDARIEDMAPGSERLISYAVNLDVEVNPRMEQSPEEIVSVKIAKGTLVATRKFARRKVFEIKNAGTKAVKLLVEHPREGGWNLVDPKQPAETTRDRHRFTLVAEPGRPTKLEVAEERPDVQHVALSNLDDNLILFYSRAKVTSPAVKEALEQVIAKKRAVAEAVRAKQEKEREIQVVEQEQNRIRQNMAQLDRTNELYAKYVKKFAEQEERVETLRREITALIQQEQEARKALDEYLLKMDLS
ncbi:MAG: hypothetical protein ACKOWG_19555 [Planctomycetia bacterium]